jgi:hypothetical protein
MTTLEREENMDNFEHFWQKDFPRPFLSRETRGFLPG